MYHLKPLVSLQVHLKLKRRCTNCFLNDTFQILFTGKFYRRFVYFEDTVIKSLPFAIGKLNRYIEINPAIIVVKWGLNDLFTYCRTQNTFFRFYLLS